MMKNAKKVVFCLALLVLGALLFVGCACEHRWSAATCTEPKTCRLCGEIEGYAIGHNWKSATCETPETCSSCGLTVGSATGHDWMSATCESPKTCRTCGETSGSALGHTTSAGTCSRCNQYIGENVEYIANRHVWREDDGIYFIFSLQNSQQVNVKMAATVKLKIVNDANEVVYNATHQVKESDYSTWTYSGKSFLAASIFIPYSQISKGSVESGKLYYEKITAKDGSYWESYSFTLSKGLPVKEPPTYRAGETWVVDGQWEFTITAVYEHQLCDSYRNKNYGFDNKQQGVMICYTYKNIGYGNSLTIESDWKYDCDFYVYDCRSVAARHYSEYTLWCDHIKKGDACQIGTKGSASTVFALENRSESITMYMEMKDSNGKLQKAKFVLDVLPEPEEPEEDKLNGCKITVDAKLPVTISYYNKDNTIQSSCSVTEVSFEVSGDDLYIYFTGRKTYDSRGSGQSDSCKISWKLYDDENYVIDSGTAYTLGLAKGEGFKKTKDTAYDCIEPGGTYRLVILNTN